MPGPADLFDRTPAAIAARRAYWSRRRSPAPAAGRAVSGFARNPARHLNESPVSGALILWSLILVVHFWRLGHLPDVEGVVAISLVTVGVVIVAAVAPEPVTLALVLVLVIAVARNAYVLRSAVQGVTSRFGRAVA